MKTKIKQAMFMRLHTAKVGYTYYWIVDYKSGIRRVYQGCTPKTVQCFMYDTEFCVYGLRPGRWYHGKESA